MQWLDCILVACLCDSDRNLIKPLFSNNNNTTEKPRSSVLERRDENCSRVGEGLVRSILV